MSDSTRSMPIRVAYVDHTAQWSGGEIALFNLVAELDRKLIEPIVVLFEDGPLGAKLRAIGVETRVLPADAAVLTTRKDSLGLGSLMRFREVFASFRHAWRLRRVLRERQVELVHTNSLKADLIGGLAGRLAGKRVIWHVRDRIEPDYLPGIVVRLFRLLARVVPHHVVANSESTLETVHLGRSEGARRRQSVVYSGIVLRDALPVVRSGDRVPVVGLVGRITRWKGHDVLLRAAAKLKSKGIHARYRLIGAAMFGEDAYADELQRLVRELDIADVVEFAGFRSDVPAELAMLDVLAHTSITPEPFGQVVVEGMAARRPVIATRAGGVVEIIEDGVSGLLVPPGDVDALADALARVLADPKFAAALGEAGRKRVESRFTIGRIAREVETMYARLAGRPIDVQPSTNAHTSRPIEA